VANVENGIVTSPRAIIEIATALGTTAQFLQTGKSPPDTVNFSGHGFAESQAAAPAAPHRLYDVLTKEIYDPEKMSPEEEKAVFVLQRYLKRLGR